MLPSRHAALLVSVTVIAVSIAAAAPAAAANQTRTDTTLSSGDIVWQGQAVAVDATPAVDGGDSLELRTVEDGSVGAFVTEVAVDENGTAVLSTETLDAGSYVLATDGTPVAVRDGTARTSNVSAAQFQVAGQTLVASSAEQNGSTVLELQSNRQDFPALIESEGLTTAQLEGLFGSRVRRTTTDGVVVRVGPVTTLQLDGSRVDPGEYDLAVSALDTAVAANAMVTVAQADDGNDSQESPTDTPTTDAPSTDTTTDSGGEADTKSSGTTAGGGPGFTLVVGAPAVLFAAMWRYYR